MKGFALGIALFIITGLTAVGRGETRLASPSEASPAVPLCRISFERGEPVSGIGATPAIKLPWECTNDGTIFVSFVSTVSANSGLPPPPPVFPPMLLTSVSPDGHSQTYRLDQVPELYVSSEVDHYASDSGVVFLVKASKENKPVKEPYTVGTYSGEYTKNSAEQHLYIVEFSRSGEFRRSTAVDDLFHINQLGVFASGKFLAFGYDKKDHSPKLAMLNEDGAPVKFLEIPKGDAPESTPAEGNSPRRPVALTELVPSGRAILVVQDGLKAPILEISEGGATRAIRPHLPEGQQIKYIIPADKGLYVIAGAPGFDKDSKEAIYEVNAEDGTLLRQFELADDHRPSSELACVHDGKFLSIDHSEGSVIPLIGSAEPATKPSNPQK